MNEVTQLVLIWTGLIAFGAFVMNFIALNAPMLVLSVRASRGKKVLVNVHTMTGVYFRTGVIDGDFLVYKGRHDKGKERRRIDLKKAGDETGGSVFFRSMGVLNVAVDEATNAVLAPNMKGASAHDAIKIDHLIKRALMAPRIQDRKDVIILVLLVVILLIAAYTAFQLGKIKELITAAQAVKPAVA